MSRPLVEHWISPIDAAGFGHVKSELCSSRVRIAVRYDNEILLSMILKKSVRSQGEDSGKRLASCNKY